MQQTLLAGLKKADFLACLLSLIQQFQAHLFHFAFTFRTGFTSLRADLICFSSVLNTQN